MSSSSSIVDADPSIDRWSVAVDRAINLSIDRSIDQSALLSTSSPSLVPSSKNNESSAATGGGSDRKLLFEGVVVPSVINVDANVDVDVRDIDVIHVSGLPDVDVNVDMLRLRFRF